MRRIVMFNQVSADGSFSNGSGPLDWVVPEPALDRMAAANLEKGDAILFGRKTYEMFEAFWPGADGRDPHGPGSSPEIAAIGAWINEAEKLVVSRTRRDYTWQHTRHLPAFTPDVIDELKRGPGKDILVFGSGSLATPLVEHGLLDELQLVVTPVLLEGGRPLFAGLAVRRGLTLLEARPFPSGNVLLRYALRR